MTSLSTSIGILREGANIPDPSQIKKDFSKLMHNMPITVNKSPVDSLCILDNRLPLLDLKCSWCRLCRLMFRLLNMLPGLFIIIVFAEQFSNSKYAKQKVVFVWGNSLMKHNTDWLTAWHSSGYCHCHFISLSKMNSSKKKKLNCSQMCRLLCAS